jgi:hypothetical protein
LTREAEKNVERNSFDLFRRQVPTIQHSTHNLVSNGVAEDPATMEASSSVVVATAGKPSSTSSGGVGGGGGRSGGGVGSASGSRSVSLASVSSDGSSSESHLVEQEDIVALTQEVRAFKEALGKLRRLFHPNDKGKTNPKNDFQISSANPSSPIYNYL